MTRHDTAAQLDFIWQALEAYRDEVIPEGKPSHDEEWDDICTAMWWITEDLGFENDAVAGGLVRVE
jgi:hypothetical protein